MSAISVKTPIVREISLNKERQNRYENYHRNKERGQDPENITDYSKWKDLRAKADLFYRPLGLQNIEIRNIGEDLGRHITLDHYNGFPKISNTILEKSRELRKRNGDAVPGSVYSIAECVATPEQDPRYFAFRMKSLPFYVSEAVCTIAKETGHPTEESYGVLTTVNLVKVKIGGIDHLAFAMNTPHNPNPAGIESACPAYSIHVGQNLVHFGDLIADELEFRFNYDIAYPSKIFAITSWPYTREQPGPDLDVPSPFNSHGIHYMTRIGTEYNKKEDVQWIGSGNLHYEPLESSSMAKFLAANLDNIKSELKTGIFAYATKMFGSAFLDALGNELGIQ